MPHSWVQCEERCIEFGVDGAVEDNVVQDLR